MKKEFVKKHKYLFIAIIFGLSLFLPYVFFNDSIYIFSGDYLEQLVPIYTEGWRRLRTGSGLFWDWSNFLGANYYGSDLYYCFGSPFFWLSMLVPSIDLVPKTFVYMYMLKVVLCIAFTYMWLYEVSENDLAGAVGSLMVTFCAFLLANLGDGIMLDGLLFFGLGLYFAEKYLKNGKALGVTLSTAIIGIVNYYLLYIFLPFLCMYILMRYLVTKSDLKCIVRDGFIFVIYMVLGVLCASVVLIPAIYALSGTPKSDELVIGLATVGRYNIYRFITSFFTPISDWRQNYNFFISTELENVGVSHGGGYSNYSLIIAVFALIPLLFIKDKKVKYGALSLLSIYGVFSVFKVFYVLLNRNYATRWMVMITFLLAYIVALVIRERKDIPCFVFIISVALCIGAVVFFTWFSFRQGYVLWDWEKATLKRNLIIISLFLVLLTLGFVCDRKWTSVLIMITVCLDVCFSFYNLYNNIDGNGPISSTEFNDIYHKEKGAAEYIMASDDSFYRIDQSTVPPYGLNSNLALGYKSFVGYHSLLNYNGLDFMNGRFTSDGHCVINVQKGKDLIKTMLCSKYWYVYDPIVFDNGCGEYESIPPFGYSFYGRSDDGAYIYVNDYPISFGYMREKTVSKDDFDSMDTLAQDYMLLDHVVIDQPEISDVQLFTVFELSNKPRHYDIPDKKGVLYVSAGREKGVAGSWSLYADDSQGLTYGYLGYYDYYGIVIPGNADHFTMNNKADVTLFYDDMSWFKDWYASQNMVDFNSVSYDDNSIQGAITVKKDGWFVTSVPYDQGWTVKVDGNKTDFSKVNNGFVGFELNAGRHLVEMRYFPPGLKIGTVISAFAFAVLLLLKKRSR